MKIEQLTPLVQCLPPATFAEIDSVTRPSPGVRKVTKGELVLLFSNTTSGYERLVRGRLKQMGKDPDKFLLGDLPWGEKVEGTPLIIHKDKYYLQTFTVRAGDTRYYVGDTDTELSAHLFDKKKAYNSQGLPPESQVYVKAYALDNIKRIVIAKEEVVS